MAMKLLNNKIFKEYIQEQEKYLEPLFECDNEMSELTRQIRNLIEKKRKKSLQKKLIIGKIVVDKLITPADLKRLTGYTVEYIYKLGTFYKEYNGIEKKKSPNIKTKNSINKGSNREE